MRPPSPGQRIRGRSRAGGASPPGAPYRTWCRCRRRRALCLRARSWDAGRQWSPSPRMVSGRHRARCRVLRRGSFRTRRCWAQAAPHPPHPALPFLLPTTSPRPPALRLRSPALRGHRAAAHGCSAAGREHHAPPALGARHARLHSRRGSRAERCSAHPEAADAAGGGKGEGQRAGGERELPREGTGRVGRWARICSRSLRRPWLP